MSVENHVFADDDPTTQAPLSTATVHTPHPPAAPSHQSTHTDTETVITEFIRLLTMLDDLEHHPDIHTGLPLTVDNIRTTVPNLLGRPIHRHEHHRRTGARPSGR
ncbi:hypothetical protein ACQPZF_36270 [Actinosynnema sp. CS-041913]|uniref:hypothetical protein n=1 Tax=Actinosynnema sp. CS-041913 TaxID=3239917 RepID=UPI003D90ED0A